MPSAWQEDVSLPSSTRMETSSASSTSSMHWPPCSSLRSLWQAPHLSSNRSQSHRSRYIPTSPSISTTVGLRHETEGETSSRRRFEALLPEFTDAAGQSDTVISALRVKATFSGTVSRTAALNE